VLALGQRCRPLGGCGCAPDCEAIFPSAVDCALVCSAQGQCNQDVLVGRGLVQQTAQGSWCDNLDVCLDNASELDGESWFGAPVSCDGTERCSGSLTYPLARSTLIDAALWQRICATSLLPITRVECWLYGP
jgi:hypothetical protein